MNLHEYILTCTSEECVEISHRISKALRFGLSEVQDGQQKTNAQRIAEELTDLIATVQLLEAMNLIPVPADRMQAIDRKKLKIQEYSKKSIALGTLVL